MLRGVDAETALIRPGLLAPPMTCMSFAWRNGASVESDLCNYRESVARMWDLLSEQNDEFTGVNTVYDFGVLAAEEPKLIPLIFKAFDDGRCHDGANRQKLIDNARGLLGGYFPGDGQRKVEYTYSVKGLVSRHLGIDLSVVKDAPDAWRLRYGELRDLPVEEWEESARKYAIDDGIYHLLIHEAQLPDEGLIRDAANQQRAHLALHLCSCWGVKTSPDAIRRLEEGARATYDDLTQVLVEAGLVRASRQVRPSRKNPQGRWTDPTRDTKAAKARMFAVMTALGEPVKLTETGEELAKERELTLAEVEEYACLDEDACIESGDEILLKYAERTSIQTVVSSHIPRLWLGVDTPLQARFEVILETGRTSCKFKEKRKAGDPPESTNGYQLQNVRRMPGIRECMVPRPGMVFYDVDFAQLELRTVAQVLLKIVGWSRLAEALNAGKDVHLALAAQIVGMSYEEALERKKEENVKKARQISKGANFGYPGSMGAKGFQIYARTQPERIILSLDQCRELRENWLNTWPEFREYFEWAKSVCAAEGGITMEQLFSGRLRGRVVYGQLCNGMFQGLGADAAKAALYEVSKRCYTEQPCAMCGGDGTNDDDPRIGCYRCGGDGISPLYGTRPWTFVHDQIIGEAPEETAEQAAFECRDIMVREANKWLPDVPVTAEPVISRCWSKDASPVWLEAKMLPWTLDIGAYREARTNVSAARRDGVNEINGKSVDDWRKMQSEAWERMDEPSQDAMIEEGGK